MAMKSHLLLIIVSLLLLLSACQPQLTDSDFDDSVKLPAENKWLTDYLNDVPAVKGIEQWPNDYADGITITTDHYIIHTTLLEPLMLRQLAAFVESAHAAYQSQLPQPFETDTKFTLYLFADRAQWEEFTKDFAGRMAPMYFKIKKGAYYLNGACVTYNIGRTRTFSVIGHEGWHQFNSRHFTFRLPSWLDEGIATLFEVSQYQNNRFNFQPGRNLARLGALKQTILNKKMIPLEQLIVLNPGQVVADSDATLAFYSQSYALVRFLREEDYGKRLAKYHNLLLAGLRGNWPLDESVRKIAADRNIPLTTKFNSYVSPMLFELYIDPDIKEIETEYIRFCKKIVYPVTLKN